MIGGDVEVRVTLDDNSSEDARPQPARKIPQNNNRTPFPSPANTPPTNRRQNDRDYYQQPKQTNYNQTQYERVPVLFSQYGNVDIEVENPNEDVYFFY